MAAHAAARAVPNASIGSRDADMQQARIAVVVCGRFFFLRGVSMNKQYSAGYHGADLLPRLPVKKRKPPSPHPIAFTILGNFGNVYFQ